MSIQIRLVSIVVSCGLYLLATGDGFAETSVVRTMRPKLDRPTEKGSSLRVQVLGICRQNPNLPQCRLMPLVKPRLQLDQPSQTIKPRLQLDQPSQTND
jgi:hypothetical protein